MRIPRARIGSASSRAPVPTTWKIWPLLILPTWISNGFALRTSVMVRGRAGGTGAQFNLGEMTVTRCSVRLPDGAVGHGYASGRSRRQAELAALLDARLQQHELQATLLEQVIEPLRKVESDRRLLASRKAAATKVEFFTMVRGDNLS